jgi:hypothetical protein
MSALAARLTVPAGRAGTAAFLETRPGRFAQPPPGVVT